MPDKQQIDQLESWITAIFIALLIVLLFSALYVWEIAKVFTV